MDKEKLEKLISERLTQPEIAKRLAVSPATVKRWLKKFGLKTNPIYKSSLGTGERSRFYLVDWKKIQTEYDAGLNYKGVTEKYGISPAVLNRGRIEGVFTTRSIKEARRLFIDGLSDEERVKHFRREGNPNEKKGGYREGSGRSKKYFVLDSFGNKVCLQSSYEKTVAEILDDLNIKWVRPGYLKYDSKKYFPDFLLTEKNIYLDPKNDFLAKKDEEKIKKACKQNNVVILILTKDKINKDYINGL